MKTFIVPTSKVTLLLFMLVSVSQSAFSQSKKEQIEILVFQKDSLARLITNEKNQEMARKIDIEKQINKLNSIIKKDEDKLAISLQAIEEKRKKIQTLESAASELVKSNKALNDELFLLKEPKAKEVKIGEQVWMAENLNVNKFRNGDLILEAKTSQEWKKAGENKQPAWCYYENNLSNGEKYGKLYNWYAVNDSRGLAPEGYHLPSDDEWTKLTDYLGGVELAGTKMKAIGGWKENGNGVLSNGFSGLPGGFRDPSGTFFSIGTNGYWWSSTEGRSNYPWYRNLSFDEIGVHRTYNFKEDGFSVRCIKD